ncbi:MAG: HEPN domain-containing protein [Planctomycetota bacterium]
MPPEALEVRAWLEKAQRDRRTADAALQLQPPITDIAGFHAQQAAEKTLKAYLVWRQTEFERIHDLEILVDSCAAHDHAFADLRDQVRGLTAFAVRYRYPGPADPTLEQASTALQVADTVWKFVTGRLPEPITRGLA